VYDPSPAVVAGLPTAVKALDVIVPGWTVIPERAAPPESATLPLIVVVTTARVLAGTNRPISRTTAARAAPTRVAWER
jgi:hypothetical protein